MSIKLMSQIWDDAPFEKTTLLVLLCLADMANDRGVCWPSVETIAKKARCSERWVRDVLVELEAAGYVGKEPRAGQTTRYHVHFPPIEGLGDEPHFRPEETAPLNPSSGEGGTPVPVGAEPHRRRGGSAVQPNHKEPSIEPSLNPQTVLQDTTSPSPTDGAYSETEEFLLSLAPKHADRPDWLADYGYEAAVADGAEYGFNPDEAVTRFEQAMASGWGGREKPNTQRFVTTWLFMERIAQRDGTPLPGQVSRPDTPESLKACFDLFWEAYPKKERMTLAIAAFKTAVTLTDVASIITAAKGYARLVRRDGTEPQFIASPHKWLADRRWTDEYPTGLPSMSHTAADD